MELKNIVLVDGIRSPFARGSGRGKLVATRLDEVGATVVRALFERNPKVMPSMVQDVGLGTVSTSGEYLDIGRVPRMAGLPLEVSSFSSNRHCGSSMETLHRMAMSIMVGAYDCGISLGVERMARPGTNVPPPTNRVTEPKRVPLTPDQRALAPDHFNMFSVPIPDYILDSPVESSYMQPMSQTAQNVAEMYGLTRLELDEFSVRSHHKYGAAWDRGVYKGEIVPLEIEEPVFDEMGNWVPEEHGKTISFERDECFRPGTNIEALSTLKPVPGYVSFASKELLITAGNTCPTNDGASAALIMSEEKARELRLEPLARIIGIGVGGVKPQVMGIGPVPSTRNALRHAGITADQIDRVEFNEAFACQVIASIRDLGIPEEKVNVNGGSLAIGHPIGATGARLVMTVAKELRRSGLRYGLATQCMGAGMGISTIVEAMY